MQDTLLYALYGTLAGVVGTGIGGVLAFTTKKSGNRFIASILEYSAGLMMAIILLDLLPGAFEHASLPIVLLGVFGGLFFMFLVESLTEKHQRASKVKSLSEFRKMGLVLAIGVAVHNFPEGLAIGAGFDTSFVLGLSLAITILIHDIPEGIAMAIPLKLGGLSMTKTVLITMASGVPMGIGALIGGLTGNISEEFVSICLAAAGGAMLHIVLADLIPQAKKMYSGRLSSFFNILGVITGIILSVGLG